VMPSGQPKRTTSLAEHPDTRMVMMPSRPASPARLVVGLRTPHAFLIAGRTVEG